MDQPPPRDARSRINTLFERALGVARDQREQMLLDACPDDPAVREEVLSLLSHHDRADDFLASPPPIVQGFGAFEDAYRLVGARLGQYEVKTLLGRGGMGVVYLAVDHQLRRDVALKAIAPEFASDPARRARLAREAQAASPLTHPGIAAVYALEDIDGVVFIVGEYVEGATLREELAHGPLDLRLMLDTAIELAEALGVAHDRGIVHRDLKPENVIRALDGHVKILDFGLAQIRDTADAERLTDDGAVLGTPGYMSPEQIRSEAVDARSDLFSLGIVMWEMLTGRHPFKGEGSAGTIARILQAEPAAAGGSGASKGPDASLRREIDGIVRICLSKSRDGRFASAQALLSALQRARAGLPSAVHSAGSSAVASAALPLWWWKFHQAATSVAYALLMIPLWIARTEIGGRSGLLLFLVALVAVVAPTIMRWHLWFTAESLPAEWQAQRAHTRPWMLMADGLFVLVLLAAGLLMIEANNGLSELLVGSAVVVLLGFTLIEPATTRAAFGRH